MDSLSQPKPIEVDFFTDQSVEHICNERGAVLLTNTFHRALSHLQFGNDGVIIHKETEKLSKILQDDANPLQNCIIRRFRQLLSKSDINKNMGDFVGANMMDNQQREGSFYRHFCDIIDKIAVVAMMQILQTLYENMNIAIINNNGNDVLNKIFIKLYFDTNFIKDNPMRQSVKNIIKEQRPNKLYIKYEYDSQFPFSKTIHRWCQNQLISIFNNVTDNQQYIVGNVQEMKTGSKEVGGIPVICDRLSLEVIHYYVMDLLCLDAYLLQIDESWPEETHKLIVQFMVFIATDFFQNKDERISVIELETLLFFKRDLLFHLIKICSILPVEAVLKMAKIINLGGKRRLQYCLEQLLQKIVYSSNYSLYKSYITHSIDRSIDYIVNYSNLEEQKRNKC